MYAKQRVIDQDGTVYESITEAAKILKASAKRIALGFKTNGKYNTLKGSTLFPFSGDSSIPPETPSANTPAQEDPLFRKLKERYSLNELKELAKGEGLDKRRIDYPEINLDGKHHKLLVISDTHIGSIYSPEEWHDIVRQTADREKVEAVLHCGDLVDGLKISRAGTQVYELSEVGYDAQLKKAVEIFSKYRQPVYIISGNHDMYFKEFAGANIVKAFADSLPNVTYIGHDSADIKVGDVLIRLFHGGDGSSYAVSYRLQKLVESINGGHKPDILLCGHVHKFCYILERNIHAISVPCLQAQTVFMRSKKLAAHTGFLILEFDSKPEGVANLSLRYFPFYA